MKTQATKLNWLSENLKELGSKGLLIQKRVIESPMGAKIKVNGKWVLNFCSNNYLGLANNPLLKKAAKKAIDKYGIGPTAVRTIAGTTKLHLKLEEELAKFKKTEAVITFQSGFMANLATIPALVGEGDIIFSDELNHASIIDACRLSKVEVVRYNHTDTKDLENKIKSKLPLNIPLKSKTLIVTDGVFSMDGDISPLPELVKLSEKYNAILMVDDAHGEGVLGKNGRGIVDHFNLHGKVDIEIGTMSKAIGVVGGYVAGEKVIIDWLRLRARPFLFSSAMTIPDVAACISAVKILQKSDKQVLKLWDNTKYFKEKIKGLGFDIGKSKTPIVPVMLGEVKLAQEFSKRLFENGIFAMAIGYPTVPEGSARIRVMMSAAHSKNDLDKALEVFSNVGKKLGVIS
ncbi:8-amino-7-oxononanoate synthase [Candidatus Woesebacteria bacterium RIFCSPHIGHO2_01_FULL_39_32]|uniref:8-amino-7-ketopelargonate synthase n=2 Tax=Candidatus Woeseibacteriota TaxID=1752722 RepID=A0A0G0PXS4_9BACT|nr:MAG: 8-amino-7-oxononanoate synthetase [Candidatus Woesebacteria bacterium GW2011_GWA1_39_8]OGM04841.1 MAG: 8-amino-7-oxononanoate synthase [Candidatus Woesebacteria bacterium GWB1_37_5]OGM25241.1 MAG: 8-amino-7-oxononanoate synthase [Candidatus Woesebacteria bacterium RIFCSPHIGHO2_01_FULL_39_32]OGM37741.1 MAG: 8-amino-7-oxononanoate synthase [Candidatus Woesebacteria bacterium RIFCSPHIGHO2_12_FULL_38_11]OGM64772.1 MAG: 8-amino-7-oxononanoate synthase [Candidatus Woesebacteria bacterium RIFC